MLCCRELVQQALSPKRPTRGLAFPVAVLLLQPATEH